MDLKRFSISSKKINTSDGLLTSTTRRVFNLFQTTYNSFDINLHRFKQIIFLIFIICQSDQYRLLTFKWHRLFLILKIKTFFFSSAETRYGAWVVCCVRHGAKKNGSKHISWYSCFVIKKHARIHPQVRFCRQNSSSFFVRRKRFLKFVRNISYSLRIHGSILSAIVFFFLLFLLHGKPM